jgi:hypothetical protein
MSKKTKDLIEIAEGFDPYSVVDTAIGGLENATAVNRKNYAYLDYADLDKDGNPAIKGEYVTLASGIYYALGLYDVYGYYYNPNITGNDFYTVYAGKVDNRGVWTGANQTVRQADELTFARKAATTEVYATGANVNFIDTTARKCLSFNLRKARSIFEFNRMKIITALEASFANCFDAGWDCYTGKV